MCGITGIIKSSSSRSLDKDVLRKMTDAIVHRGPDEDGFFEDERVGLGMRRLSIIDLSHGRQPISSAEERYLIFYNGEVYNYKEIKKELGDYDFKTDSDTEVILAGYIKWGEKVLEKLRGMFAFAIYDKEKKELFIARDFFGIKPLYLLASENYTKNALSSRARDARSTPAVAVRDVFLDSSRRLLGFSSEIKSFLAIPGFKPEVNDSAVFNYLSYQYNPLDETFFKGVYKLPPAHFMKVDVVTGAAQIERYWQFQFRQDENLEEENTKEKILEVMKDSVAHHMIADVPVGSFLSGGIDSSIIATLMQKLRGDTSTSPSAGKVKTFTVGFDSLTEGREARETAEPLSTEHKEITVGPDEYFEALPKVAWHFDEPVADPSAVGLYFLAKEARKHVKVVLSGEGSDELFGGYNIYLAPFAYKKLSWVPKTILKLFLRIPFEFFGKNYLRRASSQLSDWYIGNASIFKSDEIKKLWKGNQVSRTVLDTLYKQVEGLSDSVAMQYIDIHTWLVGDILAKADKMTMAHSLELRVPFLDVEVAKIASTLPDRFKWRGGTTKYLLREAFKNVLPESTRQRKKLGFPTPVRHWFDKDRRDIYELILQNDYINKHMDISYIKGLIDDHVSKKTDNSRKIYLLLMLALWYNKFIK